MICNICNAEPGEHHRKTCTNRPPDNAKIPWEDNDKTEATCKEKFNDLQFPGGFPRSGEHELEEPERSEDYTDPKFQDDIIEHLNGKNMAYASFFLHFIFDGIPFSDCVAEAEKMMDKGIEVKSSVSVNGSLQEYFKQANAVDYGADPAAYFKKKAKDAYDLLLKWGKHEARCECFQRGDCTCGFSADHVRLYRDLTP